jgi:starch synthase
LKILMVSSEAAPFAKSGGLADAVSALARALRREGHDARIVLPRYYSIDQKDLSPVDGPLGVPLGDREEWGAVFESTLPDSDVPVYFIEHEGYFGRDGIYGNRQESDFADNPRRFSFFSRAAFQLCRRLSWIPDILHAHDWPSSLVPVYYGAFEAEGAFSGTATVLTIHNLGYQGIYPKESFGHVGLPWEAFHKYGLEFYDALNLLKAGITSAEKLTTVSPSYSYEIQTPEQGCRLDGLLRHRSADLVGILNGVDLDDWNPATDRYLPARYSPDDMAGKAACKAALQREFGLPEDPGIPIVGMVSRLADQKGIGELFGADYGAVAPLCRDMALQFVALGSGDAWCEAELRSLSERLPNFKARIGYSEKIAHLIEAGSDFFLMPSRYEPCGLNQMYSLRYGTLPIVHRTGGLADTVSNYDQNSGAGTGFMFDHLTPRAIYDTVGWAIWAWYNKQDHLEAMRQRAMRLEFSWQLSAREYLSLYENAILAKRDALL